MSVKQLTQLTNDLQTAENDLLKTKVLMDMELNYFPVEQLESSPTLLDFLNILKHMSGQHSTFIQQNFLFYLLRLSTFSTTNYDTNNIKQCMSLLNNVCNAAETIPTVSSSNFLNNQLVITHLKQYITSNSTFTGQTEPIVPNNVILTFRCVEELVHACFQCYWNFPFQSQIPYTSNGALEKWLLTRHLKALGLDYSAFGSLKEQATNLITNEKHIFVPLSSSEYCINLFLAKNQALDIYNSFTTNPITRSNVPVLAFSSKELTNATPELFFLYDFIIEGLYYEHSYNIPQDIVEQFISKTIHFMTELCNTIQIKCSHKLLSSSDIRDIKELLQTCGLTEDCCHRLQTNVLILNVNSGNNSWKGYDTFVSLINQLVLFSDYFYKCLFHFSPTSISYAKITELLNIVSAIESETLGQLNKFSWKLANMLTFFVPKAPSKLILETYMNISPYLMKSAFSIWAKKTWNYTWLDATSTHSSPKHTFTHIAVIPQFEVQKYCESLQLGTTEYNSTIVNSPFFAGEFINHHIVPTITAILQNKVHKNRALFQLRWLIVFASDEAKGLYRIRRPLGLLYFQIIEIINNCSTQTAILNVLDYLLEIQQLIQYHVPTYTTPIKFIQEIFFIKYKPRSIELTKSILKFITETEACVQKILPLIQLSTKMCNITYSGINDTYKVNMQGLQKPASIDQKALIDAIKAIQSLTKENWVIINHTYQELQTAYIKLATILETIEKISLHSVAIKVSSPNFIKLNNMFLQCFKRYNVIANLITNSHGFNLTKYFRQLFEPELIPVTTIQKIINFNDETDDPQVFLDSLSQPLETYTVRPDKSELTPEDLNHLLEFSHQPCETGPSSIKLNYTDIFNTSKVDINWKTYKHTTYIADNPAELQFTHLTSALLDENLSK
ncbi:orf 63 [Ateline gammaherpesvirus 3]|uniref:Orf 63 n=1 Tax=Ateline herpesvirus 3 TaxID=85618 RepID=Q9YTK4_ATHV3|nr:orf 63 [Ateline gammaherpesvirus 3]AAC95587.1 orf 63 [Ateline gammaherpesvirus 3]